MDKTKKNHPNPEDLLKAIDDYVDKELYEEKEEDQIKEEVKKADSKEEEKKEDDKKKKGEGKEEEEEEKEEKCSAKKSLTDDEVKEYQDLKKAKEEKEREEQEMQQKEEKENVMKSFSVLTDAIQSLNEKVEALSKSPVSEPKSVDGVDYMKKGKDGDDNQINEEGDLFKSLKTDVPAPLFKAKVANLMFEKGVKEGKFKTEDVAEYEATGKLLDPSGSKIRMVKSLVDDAVKTGEF